MSDNQSDADNDELKLFVSSSLRAIMGAVTDVQESATASSAFGTGEWRFNPPREVEFDVAVQAKKTGQSGGGLKVEVFSIGANARKDAAHENSTVSRIKFSIWTGFKSNK